MKALQVFLTVILCFCLLSFQLFADLGTPNLSGVIQQKINAAQEKQSTNLCQRPLGPNNELGVDDLVAQALDCNPVAKARLAEIPISRVEMAELGLIESPLLSVGTLFPIKSPKAVTGMDASLTFNLTDVMQLAARKRMGEANFNQKKFETLSALLRIIANVKTASYQFQTQRQLLDFWSANLQLAKATAALAKAQRRAGNISELEEAQHLAFTKMIELEIVKAENELKQARIILARLLGADEDQFPFQVIAKLPTLPKQTPDIETLKNLAKEQRPDILATKQEVVSHQHAFDVAKFNFFPRMDLGVHMDRDPEGNFGMGPIIQVQLPFFGQRNVGMQKAQAQIDASKQALQALERNTPNELDNLFQKLKQAEQVVQLYETEILPLQNKIMKESLKQYNFMLLGNYQLFIFKQNQLNAQKEAILARRDYFIALAEIENLVGIATNSKEHL